MKATTKAIIAAVFALAVSAGLIYWQANAGRAHSLTTLTPEDMALIAESLAPQERMMLASDGEARKTLAENLKGVLALAAEARREGIADRPEVKRHLEVMRSFVLAQTYALKQREDGAQASAQPYTDEEVQAFIAEPNSQKEYDIFIADAQKTGFLPEGELPEAQKEQFKQRWAGAMVLARKAKESGLDKERKTQLQISLQESYRLANIYAEDLAEKLKPSDEEVNAKLEEARRQAEEVMKRARAGEDFEALAKEFSTEPGAEQSGGELPWFGRAVAGQFSGPTMVKPFEDAAFALKDNEVSDIVQTDFGYHIIKMLGRRTEKGSDGKPQEQVHVRHILFRPEVGQENPFSREQKPLREKIADAIVAERVEQRVKEITEKSQVKVAEEFAVKAPEGQPRAPLSPHGETGGAPPAQAPDQAPQGETKGGAGGKNAAPQTK